MIKVFVPMLTAMFVVMILIGFIEAASVTTEAVVQTIK